MSNPKDDNCSAELRVSACAASTSLSIRTPGRQALSTTTVQHVHLASRNDSAVAAASDPPGAAYRRCSQDYPAWRERTQDRRQQPSPPQHSHLCDQFDDDYNRSINPSRCR